MEHRRTRILQQIDIHREHGLEIGALFKPIVPRTCANILYADHMSTEGLRAKYANDPNIDLDELVPVTYVCGERSLSEVVGDDRFDYIIASHVIEHVPNVIGWLIDIGKILRPGGKLSLAIPDKRFTFDCRRELTTFAALVESYLEHRTRPSFSQVLDYFSEVADVPSSVTPLQLWSGEIDPKAVALRHPEIIKDFCEEWFRAHYDAIRDGLYLDVHCSVFTPESFLHNLDNLSKHGLLPYRLYSYIGTASGDMEFFVGLERLSDTLTMEQRRHAFMDSVKCLTSEAL